MADEGTATCIDILLAIILPPLGVFLKFGCQVPNSFSLFHSISCIFIFIFLSYSFFTWVINNSDRVLDLFVADPFRLSPWDYICCLCHHQVNFNLCKHPLISLPLASVSFSFSYIKHFFFKFCFTNYKSKIY